MCGAFATSPPSGPKMAHEKSRRSLMFVEIDVRCSTCENTFQNQIIGRNKRL